MYLYGVTVNIDKDVHDEWLQWMRQEHIPNVMATGMFQSHRLCRLLGDEDSEGITYSVQYVCESMQNYQQYQSKYAPALQTEVVEKYGDKFVAFRTLLEIID